MDLRNRWRITNRNEDGFSLMEIMLVFAIIAVVSSITMPAMKGVSSSRRLKTSARAIVDTLSFARDMAITERNTHLVVFDLTGNRFWLASSETLDIQNPLSSAGRATTPSPAPTTIPGQATPIPVSRAGGVMGIPRTLQKSVSFASMVTNHNGTYQRITTGAEYTYFTPTSKSSETTLYLQNTNGNAISISVEGSTGRVSMEQLTQDQIETLGIGENIEND
ncbi:prepilin-type N-terminal cleavage/methylation domain-containing protein [Candidatus Poribacteria bacterium]|nr:prepilin-type N-terminal cleavage/methylation domain-containing protein [Candidatus Poribacteria bacterium]